MAPRSSVVHALLFGVLGAVALSFTWSMVLQWVVKVRLDNASTAAAAGGRRAARHQMSSRFHSLVCGWSWRSDGLQYEMTRHAKLFVQPLRWPELFGQTQ